MRTMLAIVAILVLASTLWALPPPEAGVPVELTAIQGSTLTHQGQNERLAPAALMKRGQNQHRMRPEMEAPPDAASGNQPPARASPATALLGTDDTLLQTQTRNGGQWEGVNSPAGGARR